MPNLTPEQEQQTIDDLAALDWTRASDFEARSAQVISERLKCSIEDANIILQRLQAKKIIEAKSESGGSPAPHRTLDSYGWKWVKTR